MSSLPQVLLAHDGELDDVQSVLEQLGVGFVERRGQPQEDDHSTPWALIVGSPRRVLELQVGAAGAKPTRVAMIDGDSKTLVAMLRRSGVDMMVQRPVHPAALRLLLLHSIYRGPEKRKHARITVGAPTRFRAGMFKKTGTLADISLRGCRLLSTTKVKRDQKIKIFMGTELGCSRSFGMLGRVVRSGPTEGAGDGMQAIAVCFDVVTRDEANYLKQIIRAHVAGPHQLEREAEGARAAVGTTRDDSSDILDEGMEEFAAEAEASGEAAPSPLPSSESDIEAAAQRVARMQVRRSAPDPRLEGEELPEGSTSAGDESQGDDSERRIGERYQLDRHIIALGVEATRVLIGRDISVSGMRIEPNDTLAIGDELRMALHVRARSEPLVVSARVHADYGEEGIALTFIDLSDTAKNYLQKMVNFLPILAARGGDEGSGVIVSEILRRDDVDLSSPPPAA